ncbi:MAG: hypothetical protein OEZ36_12250, partial [Spirochaetota bacterium]|nr:hypothetical protein [Spirochaetota bacterium]
IDPKVIGGFYYYFDLLMPALNNYRYNLFQFRLNIDNSIDLIYYKKTGFKEERYHTLEELKKGLHFFFESDYCKNVISTLLSQVES